MSYFIGIEDLVANALIELVEQTGNRTVAFSQLNKYADAVVEKLKDDDIDVILIYTRDATNQFFHDCSDIFKVSEVENDIKITLNPGISTLHLRKRFRINLSLQILPAFVSKDTLKVILGTENESF